MKFNTTFIKKNFCLRHSLTIILYLLCYIYVGDKMKKNIIMIILAISSGVAFTFFFLNKGVFYAKEEYSVYAFQVGAFKDYDNAKNFINNIPSGIIVNEDNLYKIYVGIYKDIDLVNKMIVYFENKDINIYLKSVKVDKEFYNSVDSFEKILNNTEEEKIYNKTNQAILDLYLEGVINEKNF